MLKQFGFFLVISMLVVIFTNSVHKFIVYLDMLYIFINGNVSPFFRQMGLSPVVKSISLLTFIPVIITGIPALVYRLARGKTMPYLIEATWCLWLVITLSTLLIR